MTTNPVVLVSFAEESFSWARQELRERFDVDLQRLGPELGALSGPTVRDVADACARQDIVFARHLTVEQCRLEGAEANDVEAMVQATASAVSDQQPGALALQVWSSGTPRFDYNGGALFTSVRDALTAAGYEVTRAGQANVLSCCVVPNRVCIGLNELRHSLADWPGGKVRLARSDERTSRAEFKLEELFKLCPVAVSGGRALDLGASPGGWTRVLRRLGFEVVAVDPGELEQHVASDRGVRHVRQTAGEYLRASTESFRIVTNDMRMDPVRSCNVMLQAADRLAPGGLIVITLKLGDGRPVQTVRQSLTLLREAYDVLFARQLHHNRREVTVLARRRATA
ncbi:MAG TPA: SAM-dependent methyltransferase [Polyangiaceae bacterium]|nr:SAM-dependent methyltransferase [Polyangiaceae bacterium]